MEKEATFLKDFFKRLKEDKKLLAVLLIGIIGAALILFSEFFEDDEKEKSKDIKEPTKASYSHETEERLKNIISSIDGAGETKVMVTLENSSEQVYAQNEKVKSDNSNKSEDKRLNSSGEKEYVLIKGNSHNEEGLKVKLIEPKIRGVAVVCEGGDDDSIRQEIIETVTAVLDISASRVYVTKMGK